MAAYLITGLSGSGKTTVGEVLRQRGYRVIETDSQPGLSAFYAKDSGQKVTDLPPQPYAQEWLDRHLWQWDEAVLVALVRTAKDEPLFFCGGSSNQYDFAGLFTKYFALYADAPTTKRRLQSREPERWADDSAELKRTLTWAKVFREETEAKGVPVINTSADSPATIADRILQQIKAHEA